jgi:hypothetical protein
MQKSLFLFLFVVALIVSPVVAGNFSQEMNPSQVVYLNKTYVKNDSGAIPFNVWAGAIIAGLVLLILSFLKFPRGEEGLISIMAWFPIGIALFSSFAVERITSAGIAIDATGELIIIEQYTVTSYTTIALGLFVLLVFGFGNTYRIWAYQTKAMKEEAQEVME